MGYEHLRYAWRSEIGKVRRNNEDAVAIVSAEGAFFVADGMGGGSDGEVASAWTVEGVMRALRNVKKPQRLPLAIALKCERIESELNRVSRLLRERVGDDPAARKCGSTVAGILFDAAEPGQAVTVHAGDSRVYRWRDGVLRLLTRDHNMGLVSGLSENELAPRFRAMLTRAVGLAPQVMLDRSTVDVRSGDIFMVCSDGLSGLVKEGQIACVLADWHKLDEQDHQAAGLAIAVGRLIDLAMDAGGKDNCTVSLIAVGEFPSESSEVLYAVEDGPPESDGTSEAETARTDTATIAETAEANLSAGPGGSMPHVCLWGETEAVGAGTLGMGTEHAERTEGKVVESISGSKHEPVAISPESVAPMTSHAGRRPAWNLWRALVLLLLIPGFAWIIRWRQTGSSDQIAEPKPPASSSNQQVVAENVIVSATGSMPNITNRSLNDRVATKAAMPDAIESETRSQDLAGLQTNLSERVVAMGVTSVVPATVDVELAQPWLEQVGVRWCTGGDNSSWQVLTATNQLPVDDVVLIEYTHPDFGKLVRKQATGKGPLVLRLDDSWLSARRWQWSREPRASLGVEWRLSGSDAWHPLLADTRFLVGEHYELRFKDADDAWQLETNRARMVIAKHDVLILHPPNGWQRLAPLQVRGTSADILLELCEEGSNAWRRAGLDLVTRRPYSYRFARSGYEKIQMGGSLRSSTGEVVVVEAPPIDQWRPTPPMRRLLAAESVWSDFGSGMTSNRVNQACYQAALLHQHVGGLEDANRQRAERLLARWQAYSKDMVTLSNALRTVNHFDVDKPPMVARVLEAVSALRKQMEFCREQGWPLGSELAQGVASVCLRLDRIFTTFALERSPESAPALEALQTNVLAIKRAGSELIDPERTSAAL